jgi:PAS domain S-box-containing protein
LRASTIGAAGAVKQVPAPSNELASLIAGHDWTKTPLGPAESWPQSLKTAVGIMLTSRQPIWIGWGPELIYFYNDPYKSIIGGKHPWALGRPTAEVWKEIWPDIGPMLAQALKGSEGTYVEAQLLIMERNGYPEETYYTFSYTPIPDDDGLVGGIFCANTEDTKNVIGERQLALLRELAAQAANADTWQEACTFCFEALETNRRDLPFAVLYVIEPDGKSVRRVSSVGIAKEHQAFPENLKLTQDIPWPIAKVLREHKSQHITDLAARFTAAFSGGAWDRPAHSAVVLPVSAGGEGGHSGVLIAGLNPFRLFDDSYSGFMELVAGQIGSAIANAEAYDQERRRAEALSELDRAKTTFFSNVSHEFRTPLTLMLNPMEELLAGDLPAETQNLISVAHRNGLRLLKLVNSLLDFSRVEAGRVQASFEATDLSRATAEIARLFEPVIAKAGLRLEIDCKPLPHQVYIDRDMWQKVVLNLLSNAFKFTLEGEILVRLLPSPDGRNARLIVRDTGIGIPHDQLPLLFARFHRVEGAQGRSIEGSGIGLALVQELLRLHGGSIGVESQQGAGTAFTVELPFGKNHLPENQIRTTVDQASNDVRAQPYLSEAANWISEDPSIEVTSPRSDDFPQGAADPNNKKHLVLLADDNLDMRNYIQRLLTSVGFRVETAGDGNIALERIRELKPALLLSDVMMPGLDGFSLLREIRNDPELRDMTVILLSARAGQDTKVEGLQAGADDYLSKPFSARELVARVETNLRLSDARRETARLLREEAEILDLLNKVGNTVAAEIDLEKSVQNVTDIATQLSGAAFGSFFYNVINERGKSYTLYTLSGVPREAFAKFPMPRNTAVFGPTFNGEGIVRSDDITKDPRYGQNAPHFGMPKGHLPVRSYLAAPVISSTGEVLGGLFFGHSETGKFDSRAERIVGAIAIQAAIAIEKARLYGAAKDEIRRREEVENVLRENEQQLERRVEERTRQLIAANASLRDEAEQRRSAEGRFRVLVEGVRDYAIFMLDPNGIISNWNQGAERIKGYTEAEIVGKHFSTFYTEQDKAAGVPARALETAAREGKFEAQGLRVRKGGAEFWASVVINPIRDAQGAIIGFAKITRDITEWKEAQTALQRAQEQLAQSQKMEGIGQLTGGVAHDFNNLLTIIIGNLESIQRSISASPDVNRISRSLDYAMRGAQRAASLTQRLLAFSRRQPLEPKATDLSRLINSMSELLRRTLGENIAIETVLNGGLWRVLVDQNQLEVGLLNLAVNSRDAMKAGGKLTIETANVLLDESYAASQAEVVPGQYVVISVTDTGSGMSKEVLSKAFEPFFTTKDIGQGTGLGLSQVYGFVKQSGGNVKIYSEPGHGTTVKIYLPRFYEDGNADQTDNPSLYAPTSSTNQTILVVEDEEDVRAYTSGILSELGYRVLEAANGAIALEVLGNHAEIALLFTDVGLPGGMNGRQLADAARKVRPDLKVLFTTGYARNAIVHGGRLDPGVALLPKPFTYAAVASKISDMLD